MGINLLPMTAKKRTAQDTRHAQKIRQALDGRTQRWLCSKIGMREADLSNGLKGLRPFTAEELTRINQVLGLNLCAA